jgi:CheY-like chemotaxis protein
MKILLIEDDVYMAQLYINVLKLEKLGVEQALDGVQGLAKLRSESTPPDLILLDIMMPNMDGFRFMEEFKKEEAFNKIPVVVLTNLYDPAAREKMKALGATDFFIKSEQDPQELAKSIKRILKV